MEFEHAVLEFGIYFVTSRVLGKGEAPHERAIGALNAMIFLILLFLLELAFASDSQNAVLNGDLDVFLFDLWQLQL